MIYQQFLQKRRRRLVMLILQMALWMCSTVFLFALVVTAFSNVAQLGAFALPSGFIFVIVVEVVRYFFYRSYFMQQVARIAEWNQRFDTTSNPHKSLAGQDIE